MLTSIIHFERLLGKSFTDVKYIVFTDFVHKLFFVDALISVWCLGLKFLTNVLHNSSSSRCITVFRNQQLTQFHVQPSEWKGGQVRCLFLFGRRLWASCFCLTRPPLLITWTRTRPTTWLKTLSRTRTWILRFKGSSTTPLMTTNMWDQ